MGNTNDYEYRTNEYTGVIPCSMPIALTFNPKTNELIVSNHDTNTIECIDMLSFDDKKSLNKRTLIENYCSVSLAVQPCTNNLLSCHWDGYFNISSPDGKIIKVIGDDKTSGGFEDVCCDDSGNIILVNRKYHPLGEERKNGRVRIFDTEGRYLRDLEKGQMDERRNYLKEVHGYENTIKDPQSVCIGPNSDIYVADQGNSSIHTWSKDGSTWTGFFLNNVYPSVIACDLNGMIHVVQETTINILDPRKKNIFLQNIKTSAGRYCYPGDMCFDNQNTLLVADFRKNVGIFPMLTDEERQELEKLNPHPQEENVLEMILRVSAEQGIEQKKETYFAERKG